MNEIDALTQQRLAMEAAFRERLDAIARLHATELKVAYGEGRLAEMDRRVAERRGESTEQHREAVANMAEAARTESEAQ